MKKYSIIIIFLFILNTLSNNIFAQFDILPPPPPPPPKDISQQKILTKEEFIEMIKSGKNTLLNDKIIGLKFNWEDADLWIIRNKRINEVEAEVVSVMYLSGLGSRYKIDTIPGILTISTQKSYEIGLLTDPMDIIEQTMKIQHPGSRLTVIEKIYSDKQKRAIFKVENVNKYASFLGQVILSDKILAIFLFEISPNFVSKKQERYWADRYKKIDLE